MVEEVDELVDDVELVDELVELLVDELVELLDDELDVLDDELLDEDELLEVLDELVVVPLSKTHNLMCEIAC